MCFSVIFDAREFAALCDGELTPDYTDPCVAGGDDGVRIETNGPVLYCINLRAPLVLY